MVTDYVKYYGNLEQELNDAKHTLVTLNDNIRRIVGRTPKEMRNDRQKAMQEVKRNDNDRQSKKSSLNDPTKYKRRPNETTKSVFSRLAPVSHDEEEESKPRLNSRVIRELPTRQEIVAAQCNDSESRARNRRIFGSLMGTLHKFCQEESRLKQKEEKKAQIEKRLEAQEIQERESLKRERELLFIDRRRKQLEIKKIELKMNRVKDYEMWESSFLKLRNNVRTKTKPHIYYRPRVLCKQTLKLLTESQDLIDSTIKKRKEQLDNELMDLEKAFNEENFEIIEENNRLDGPKSHQEFDNNDERHAGKLNSVVMSDMNGKGDEDVVDMDLSEPALNSIVVVKREGE